MSKLSIKFSSDYYTLSGMTKVVKSSDYEAELKDTLNNESVSKSQLTAKNLGYFIPIEQSSKKEFTIYMYENYISNFSEFINEPDALQVSKYNCKMYQLKADAKRLNTKRDNLELEIDTLKITITAIESKPLSEMLFNKKSELKQALTTLEKVLGFLIDIDNAITALNDEKE